MHLSLSFPLILFRLLLGLVFSGSVLAASPSPCVRPLKMATSMLPPLYFRDTESGQGRGVLVELADELSRRTGCVLEPVYESRIRVWAAFSAGMIDISLSGVATEERERIVAFLPYMKLRNALILRDDPAGSVKVSGNPMTNPVTSLAVTRGFHYGPMFDPWVKDLDARKQLTYVAEEGDAVRLVALGRVAATIVRDIAWPFYQQQYQGVNGLRLVEVDAPEMEISLMLSRRTLEPRIHSAFAVALAGIRADGTLRHILARHLDPAAVERSLLK